MNTKYSISDVLQIIQSQLETIPVSGQHVRTMSGVFKNIDILINALSEHESKEEDDA